MIISSPQWPDPETVQSIRSRATELSRQFSYTSTASRLDTPVDTSRLHVQNHPQAHQRQKSNPFDILYDPHTPLQHHSKSPSKSPAYLEIEQDILNGQSPNKNYTTGRQANPTVTLIDDSELRRGASIVSRSASLRRRNVIRKRNKMIRREDLLERIVVEDSESAGTETKLKESGRRRKRAQRPSSHRLSFLFPVRRTRSFKYYPIKSPPKFSNEKDFEDFYRACNGSETVRDLLPRSMAAYEFRNLISLIPTINIYPDLARTVSPQIGLERNIGRTFPPHPELRETPLHNRTLAPPKVENSSRFLADDEGNYKEKIFKNYRDTVFAGRHSLPPRIQDVASVNSMYLTSDDKERLDTRLLLEVLLRRTIAAKLDFRLKQQGYGGRKMPKEKPSQNFSSSASSGPSDRPDRRLKSRKQPKRQGRRPKPLGKSDSLLSEPLPSPQISFNAYMFDPIYSNSPISPGGWRRQGKSPIYETYDQKAIIAPVSQYKPKSDVIDLSPSQMFVHNFDKVDLVAKRNPPERIVSNIALYSMQPVNRSEDTFTSSEEERNSFPNRMDVRGSASTGSKSYSRGSGSPNPREGKRASESTTNTSVLQSLENLSESVHEYLRSEGVSHQLV